MNITTFDELLAAARSQPQGQRLLLVFAGAEPGAQPTPEQRAAYEAGHGGELVPLICVDKTPQDIADFASLCEESRQAGPPWAIVFAAALSGTTASPPDSAAAQVPLKGMVERIQRGDLDGMIPFDRQGQAVMLG